MESELIKSLHERLPWDGEIAPEAAMVASKATAADFSAITAGDLRKTMAELKSKYPVVRASAKLTTPERWSDFIATLVPDPLGIPTQRNPPLPRQIGGCPLFCLDDDREMQRKAYELALNGYTDIEILGGPKPEFAEECGGE